MTEKRPLFSLSFSSGTGFQPVKATGWKPVPPKLPRAKNPALFPDWAERRETGQPPHAIALPGRRSHFLFLLLLKERR
jgi:hypothetical protein